MDSVDDISPMLIALFSDFSTAIFRRKYHVSRDICYYLGYIRVFDEIALALIYFAITRLSCTSPRRGTRLYMTSLPLPPAHSQIGRWLDALKNDIYCRHYFISTPRTSSNGHVVYFYIYRRMRICTCVPITDVLRFTSITRYASSHYDYRLRVALSHT